MGSACSLQLGTGAFQYQEKLLGLFVCLLSLIKSLTYFVFRLIAQEPTRGWRRGVNLTAVSFGAVCLSGDRSLCERVVGEVSLRLTDAC